MFLHKMAGHGVTGPCNQLAFFPQASLKRLSKYRFRHPSLLFLALSSLHEYTDLWLGVPEGSQIWLMIHLQVPCIDFQEGQGSRSLGKNYFRHKTLLCSDSCSKRLQKFTLHKLIPWWHRWLATKTEPKWYCSLRASQLVWGEQNSGLWSQAIFGLW